MTQLSISESKYFDIKSYLFCTWLFSVYLASGYFNDIAITGVNDLIHVVLALATYAAMYQLPAILSYWLLNRWHKTSWTLTVLLSLLCHVIIFIDVHLYDLYGFHLNGFVWNLLTTPGGVESLGADQTGQGQIVVYIAVLFLVHTLSIVVARSRFFRGLPIPLIIVIFISATLVERVQYAVSDAQLYGPTLSRGDALFLYQPMTMRTFFEKIGIEIKKVSRVEVSQQEDKVLNYPKQVINLEKVREPLNIIFLVSESMRWDLLTPKIMPKTSSFASQALNYQHHYSGGNGTRQGMFALFYGIPGVYWDSFLRQQKGPVFFDVLNQYNYQYFVYTSARFTYPEFDRTIFSELPSESLIENANGEPWQRDMENTSALIKSIENRDSSRPFFGFLFYESTHARYSFPEEDVVNNKYLAKVDYAGLSREQLAPDIEGLKARYENAAHGIDTQLGRITDYLSQSGELSNTIIVITGDHGEEFMERGRWGHNSAFTDWQIRTPMIVHIPDQKASIITERTSHLDVISTILGLLGVKNSPSDYTTGQSLLKPQKARKIIVSSWSDIGIINDYGKLVVPFKSRTQHSNLASDLNDNPISPSKVITNMRASITSALTDAHQFYSD